MKPDAVIALERIDAGVDILIVRLDNATLRVRQLEFVLRAIIRSADADHGMPARSVLEQGRDMLATPKH